MAAVHLFNWLINIVLLRENTQCLIEPGDFITSNTVARYAARYCGSNGAILRSIFKLMELVS
jgi:hypothetical protein